MASSTLAIPPVFHKPTPAIRKSKLDNQQVRSEDELLKFFLHGSYDVERGSTTNATPPASIVDETSSTTVGVEEESSIINEEKKNKSSRCMFEETYMINISVKQPDTLPTSKQIDVRIEKTPSSDAAEKIDDDEISSIFDEDDNDEIESVIFNEINVSPEPEPQPTPLTLGNMINKTLTTIPSTPILTANPQWFVNKSKELKTEKKPTPLTTNQAEDEKLFQYLDYLENKEEKIKVSATPKKKEASKSLIKPPIEPIPIIDLEQLCRSLTVQDLKDESIRKKIFELKILIDDRHRKISSEIPLIKPRKDHLPILIAMPAGQEQSRRRTTAIPGPSLLQSKTVNHFQTSSFVPTYHQEVLSPPKHSTPYSPQIYSRRAPPPVTTATTINSNRKYQFT